MGDVNHEMPYQDWDYVNQIFQALFENPDRWQTMSDFHCTKNLSYYREKDIERLLIGTGLIEHEGYGIYKSLKLSIEGWNIIKRNGGKYYKYKADEIWKPIIQQADLEKVQTELQETQLKLNKLSLLKKPNWRERNWLWIAIFAFIMGVVGDIVKEAAKHTIWTDKSETKATTQEKKDTVHLQP